MVWKRISKVDGYASEQDRDYARDEKREGRGAARNGRWRSLLRVKRICIVLVIKFSHTSRHVPRAILYAYQSVTAAYAANKHANKHTETQKRVGSWSLPDGSL
jgi:hypothetical protein